MTPQHLLTELLVDEGAVGENVERHVPVLFAQADDVFFPQQRLAAGEEAGVGTQGLDLGEHPVHFLEGQALLVAIFRRRILQAEVGSIRISHGTLMSYFSVVSCAV